VLNLVLDGGINDPAAAAWRSVVVSGGGQVSFTQYGRVVSLIRALRSAGSWASFDDAWLLVSENSTQALTSLKQRRLATAVNSPTFTAGAGYVFDGATNYIDTGFIPSTMALSMTGSNLRLSVYEATNLSSNTISAGCSNTTNKGLSIRPRFATNTLGLLDSASVSFAINSDSRSLSALSRNDANGHAAAQPLQGRRADRHDSGHNGRQRAANGLPFHWRKQQRGSAPTSAIRHPAMGVRWRFARRRYCRTCHLHRDPGLHDGVGGERLMAIFIILSQADRDHVVGPALKPIERQATAATPAPVFILNVLVLDDPTHADVRGYLAALLQMDASDADFPPDGP
jgi:hypothetical protein